MILFPKNKDDWTEREKVLIPWFQALLPEERPKVPFKLTDYITVTDEKFYDWIKECIDAGPNGHGSRFGQLEFKLENLTNVLGEIVE